MSKLLHRSASCLRQGRLRLLVPVALCTLAFVPAAAGVPGTSITITVHDLKSGAALPEFTYLVNLDNTHDPADPDPLKRPSLAPTESHSPVVAFGDQSSPTLTLPDGRYLISVRSPDHKLWGKHITLPRDAGDVRIDMLAGPLPLGKIKVQVFHDNHWVNNALDEGEAGLAGFHVTLEEQTHSQVSVDYFNKPLCGGDCVTGPDGTVTIENLGPGTYFVAATPPVGSNWIQDSTFDGGLEVQVGVQEGSDGTGAPGEAIWEGPENATASWFGFVKPMDIARPGAGSITGRAVNWVGWPPFDHLVPDTNEPVRDPYVALSDSSNDEQVYTGRGDGNGNFTIAGVPDGTYTLSIWDEQLNYIIRFLTVTVTGGQAVDLGEVGVSRWFGWLEGTVYTDLNKNGIQDPGEPPIPNTAMDQRWRDGSIKEETFTDANGHYEYPTAEGGPLGKIFINEQGFARFGVTGASVHDEYDPSKVTHVPTDLGGALLTNQQLTEGHRSIVDWGKYTYGNEPGQIIGITYYATTRNEFDARFQKHENYEPAIPDVRVNLEGLGPDGTPNTADDTLLNVYVTDHWAHSKDCAVRDAAGNPLSFLNPLIGPNCLEVPITGNQTKDGAFDGGYAFSDYCPNGYDEQAPDVANAPCWNAAHTGHAATEPLVAGTYITHAVMPKDVGGRDLYRIVQEEDVNVDLGAQFTPAIPPPPCTGDTHVVHIDPATNPRSPYDGRTMPLCDKRLVVLQNKQNANADFFLMTNFKNGVDVAPPGRMIGHISDDIYFDRDTQSIWYGEPRPIANVPVGIRDHTGRLLLTVSSDMNGDYEALLPSTETFNCPIPQGPCPGVYLVVVNDPGDKDHPNVNFKPNYRTATLAWDVWPGLTTQLDTPLDPIAAAACELATGQPELLQVSAPYVNAANRRVTLMGDFFGAAAGRVTLTDPRAGQPVTTLTNANGGIVSWSDREIVIDVPATVSAAPKQLLVTAANGSTTAIGITLHVLGTGYNPAVVGVDVTTNPHAIQEAIDAAAPGSLLVLKPGIYRENVILWKPLILQGLGPGGIVGARELQQRQPEDPRFNILGTTIDGRFFRDNQAYWDAKLASLTWSGNQDISKGANVTVVAKDGEFGGGLGAARIDGIAIGLGQGDGGAGGLEVNGYARNLRVTNTTFDSDGGTVGGAVNLGVPYKGSQHNENIVFAYNRVLASGSLMRGGGLTIFNGADNYDVGNNTFCANFSVEYGAGISHWGLSPGGKIHDNKIYYNVAVDSGGGISIQQETPQPLADGTQILGNASGDVTVERNLLNSNYSGDDGGGIYVKRALGSRIDIRNDMIVDNGASHLGGGIALVDSSNVAIVNDTIAANVTTSASEGTDNKPHGAGLAADVNSDLFQATLPAGSKTFSDPKALYNDIFWQNDAQTLDRTTVPPTLVSQGFMDFEVFGSTATFTPRNSLLTSAYGTGTGNIVGQDPQFVAPFTLALAVGPSRLDPQTPSVDIFATEDTPPPLQGDYHIQRTSPAVDAGVSTDGTTPAPVDDYDRDSRPQGPKWDIGADEVATQAPPPPPPALAAVRIDVGGGAFTAADGRAFIADRYFTGGAIAASAAPVANTPDKPLYHDERWGSFSYAIPVANGTYDVKLHFLEMYYGSPCIGKRVFSMDVLDTPVSPDIANLDICAAAGGANTALVKTIRNVTVGDGVLNLQSIYGSADDPELAAIEVVPAVGGAPTPPAVTAKTPAAGTTNVAVGERPSATFSTAMTVSTINGSSFTLKAGATAVAASVAYDAVTRTATLTPAAPLAASTTYTATLDSTIKDTGGTPLASAVSWTFTTGAAPTPSLTAVRIDVGGGAYTAADGRTFIGDKYFTGGAKAAYSTPVLGTPDKPLYHDERWGSFSYAIPVANGTYDVKLHFVEMYYGSPCIGKRIFSIDVVDTAAKPDIADLDICAAAGGANTALVKTIGNVTVSDGFLNLQSIYGSLDDPELAAIEVIPR